MYTNFTASAQVLDGPGWEVIRTVYATPAEKKYDPRTFHRPPFDCWLTVTRAVPPACRMSTGTAVLRDGQTVHHIDTS
jgi:hypothetical protein